MTNYSTLANSLKRGLLNFSKKVSNGFSKPTQKFIADMTFGIISANSCKLTDVGRMLKEPIALKKTVERLGRNLSDFSEGEKLTRDYLNTIKPYIGSDTMLLVDAGDVAKSCSPKMEAIGSVYDGSTGKYADGYWTMGAVALTDKTQHPIPVYENLYPCTKQGGLGFRAETARCIQNLRENFDSNIPRVFDKGFDSGNIITDLIKHNEKFIIRANQNRVVVHNGKRSKTNDVARGVVCEYELVFHKKSGKTASCKIGITQVTLPNMNNIKLNMVVCKDFSEQEPLILYTNISETLESIAVRIVKAYLMRWRIEEFYAFKKQGLNFEGFRVRSLNSIRNLDLLLTITIGFIAILCENGGRIMVELIDASKRIPRTLIFLKKTKFLFYAILDGITCVLASLRCGISNLFAPPPRDNQLCFAEVKKMG